MYVSARRSAVRSAGSIKAPWSIMPRPTPRQNRRTDLGTASASPMTMQAISIHL